MILLEKSKSSSWGFKKGLIQAITGFNFPNKARTKMGQSKTKIINKLKRNNRRKQNLVVSFLFWIGCSTRVLGDKFLTKKKWKRIAVSHSFFSERTAVRWSHELQTLHKIIHPVLMHPQFYANTSTLENFDIFGKILYSKFNCFRNFSKLNGL